MTPSFSQLSFSQWGYFIIWSLAIVLGLWGIRKLIHKGPTSVLNGNRRNRLLPLLDLLGVISVLVLLGRTVFQTEAYLQTVLTLAFVLFFLWLLRSHVADFLMGIVVRIEHSIGLGETLQFEGVQGVVSKIGLRSIILETQREELVSIPYSQLSITKLSKASANPMVSSSHFELSVAKTYPAQHLKNALKQDIMSQPGSLITITPKITLVAETEDSYRFSIHCYALGKEYLTQMEHRIRQKHAIPSQSGDSP